MFSIEEVATEANAVGGAAACSVRGLQRQINMPMRFHDRAEAGQQLAARLQDYAGRPDVIVLALPRGGVPVAYEVARGLQAPLDVFVVRKLGMPGHEEYAIGALASGGVRLINEQAVALHGLDPREIDRVAAAEQTELERRERSYRGERPFPDLRGKTVILVDDGLATGSTMRAAVEALRLEGPNKIVVAVPVSAADTCFAFHGVADDIVCIMTPEPFYAVGLWYEDFSQTTDEEVHELLDRARARAA
jgi:predicted phosphoribosyltransferase